MVDLTDRMIRAAKLDASLYEEVEADRGALGQAMGVVIFSSVAAGIGTISTSGLWGIITGTVIALVGWYIWAWLIYLIGTKLLAGPDTQSDPGEVLRTIGFSASPGILRVLGIIPGLRGIVFTIAGIWMLVAMVVAVRQALDFRSTGWAVAVCVFGWWVQVLFFAIAFYFLAGTVLQT